MAYLHAFRGAARTGIALAAALVFTPSWALDLRQAYEAAEQNDATIRSARAGAAGVRERLPQARAQRRPNITFNAGANRNSLKSTTETLLGPRTSQNAYTSNNQVLQLRQPLYRPFLSALERQAEAQVEGANATLEQDEQNLVLRVSEAYFDALLARTQRGLVAAQKLTFTSQLDAAKKSFAAGAGMRTDIDEAQARLDMSLAQELEAQQNVEFTRRRLEVLIGKPFDDLADLDVQGFRPQAPVPASLAEWTAQAEAANPELRSLQAQVDAATSEIDKAQAGHKPTLDAVAAVSRSDSDSVTSVNTVYNQRYVGLQLSVPLYAGGYVSSQVRQAVADQERTREALEAGRRDLGARVYEQYRAMTEGVVRIGALEQAVRSAELALQSSRKSLAAGVRTTVDVLNAEQQRTLAARDLAEARYVYLISRIRLQTLAGHDRLANVDQANAHLIIPSAAQPLPAALP